MKDLIKTVQREVNIITDFETGEIVDTQIKRIQLVTNPDDFMLIYTELWNIIMQKTLSKSDIELAAYLIQNYSEGTPFSINNYIKTIVSKKSNKNETTYNNSPRALVKAGLICKISNGVYIINPKYAYKGSSKDRHKAIIELRDNCKNC